MANFEGGTSVQYAEKVAGDLNSAGDRGSLSRGVAEAAGIFDQHNGAWATAQQELSATVNLKQFGLDGFHIVGATDSNPADPSLELSNGRQDVTLDAQGRIFDNQNGGSPDPGGQEGPALQPPGYPQESPQVQNYQPEVPQFPQNPGYQPEIQQSPLPPDYRPEIPQAPGYFQQMPNDGPPMPFMPPIPNYYPGQFESLQPGYDQPSLEIPPLLQFMQQALNPGMPPQGYDQNGQPYAPPDNYNAMPGNGYPLLQPPMEPYQPMPPGGDPLNPLSLLNQMAPPPAFDGQPDYPQNNGDYNNNYAPPPPDVDSDGSDDSGDDSQ